jgi:hypothetical protein
MFGSLQERSRRRLLARRGPSPGGAPATSHDAGVVGNMMTLARWAAQGRGREVPAAVPLGWAPNLSQEHFRPHERPGQGLGRQIDPAAVLPAKLAEQLGALEAGSPSEIARREHAARRRRPTAPATPIRCAGPLGEPCRRQAIAEGEGATARTGGRNLGQDAVDQMRRGVGMRVGSAGGQKPRLAEKATSPRAPGSGQSPGRGAAVRKRELAPTSGDDAALMRAKARKLSR